MTASLPTPLLPTLLRPDTSLPDQAVTRPTPSHAEVVALTSLRGLAAMAIVLQHFSATAQLHCRVTIPSLVPHGYLAVDLFFSLSGFIMAMTYLDGFRRNGLREAPAFLGRRIARIVPLNTAVILLFLGAAALLGQDVVLPPGTGPADILSNLLMLQGLGIGRNVNGPSWSISSEFAAYLLFPAFLALVFARSRAPAYAATALALAGLCLVAAVHPRLGLDTEGVVQSLARCFTEFVLGMAAYRVLLEAGPARLAADSLSILLAAACAAAMFLRVDLAAALLFPPLVAALAANHGRVRRLMSHPWLHTLGLVSFSLYLLHQLFRIAAYAAWVHLRPDPAGPAEALAFAAIASLSVIPFAWLTYRYVEYPGRVLVRRLLSRRHRPAATPARNA